MGDKWDELADTLVGGYQEAFVADLSWRFVGMLERGVSNPDMLSVLVRQSRTEAMRVWAEWSDRVSEETARAFAEALEEADGEMVSSAARAGIPPRFDATPWAVNRVNEAARGMAEIVRRQNVALADNMADLWYDVTAEAVTYIQGGAGLDRVMERAVSRLAADGLETIDYKSGVRTSIDAAVRRHAVTQSNQCRNDLLDKRCDQYGLDLVMVSAHFGARPSHALWQGGIYSRSGTSSEYRGLVEATGYGSVSGLCGANCRHTMTPYVEGYSRPQSTDFSRQEALTGKTSDEYYEATQKQRSIERKIRAAKREAAMLEYAGLDNTAQRVQIGRQQARLRQFVADNHLVRDYRREKAYGIPGPDSKTYAGPYTRRVQQPRALGAVKTPSNAAQAQAPRPRYQPIGTVEDAQAYAMRFIDSGAFSPTFKGQVVYKGISLEAANAINEALFDAYQRVDGLPKLRGIKVISPTSAQGKKVFTSADAVAAYNFAEQGIFLNKEILKSASAFEAHRDEARKAFDYVVANRSKLSGPSRAIADRYAHAGRSHVDETMYGAMVHELGHHVDWTMFGAKGNEIRNGWSKYATGISGYAGADKREYMAESFVAYMRGETGKLDPSYISWVNKKSERNVSEAIIPGNSSYNDLPYELVKLQKWLPPEEYATVVHAINDDYYHSHPGDTMGFHDVQTPNGAFFYTFLIRGYGEYVIIDKEEII